MYHFFTYLIPVNMESCFSTTDLLAKGSLSLDLTLLIDIVHFLLSSSDREPVQSRVAPPLEERGTGWSCVIPVDGLKSISEL